MEVKNRKSGLDVVRCVALIFIIGVHFFYHNGYYWEKQVGIEMFIAGFVRWLTFSCVPMFIVLTGYLKAEKTMNMEHYKGIVAVLVTWVVTSIICIIFKEAYLHKGQSLAKNIVDFVQFKGADYAWYIELYIGLFMLIPFLNEMFGWNKNKKYHVIFMLTLILTVFVPSLINDVTGEILPNYFVSLWPFAYYFFGCFIRKYQPHINKFVCLGVIVVFSVIRSARTYLSAGGGNFYDGIGGGYSDFYVGIITVFLVLMLYDLNINIGWLRKILAHVSKRALHIYLLSSIADALINPLLKGYNDPPHYYWGFPFRVISVFLISLLMSEVVFPISARIGSIMINVFFTKKDDGDGEDLLLK